MYAYFKVQSVNPYIRIDQVRFSGYFCARREPRSLSPVLSPVLLGFKVIKNPRQGVPFITLPVYSPV
jgi:hypothetical protein